ncbi:MAG: hypothetical protein Q8Q08_00945 [Candidatus Omnitrophota bacterium]|nr:hypothetical protein [Candidatus Omnitrophota bacterium]
MSTIDLDWFQRHIQAWVDFHDRDNRPNMDSEEEQARLARHLWANQPGFYPNKEEKLREMLREAHDALSELSPVAMLAAEENRIEALDAWIASETGNDGWIGLFGRIEAALEPKERA